MDDPAFRNPLPDVGEADADHLKLCAMALAAVTWEQDSADTQPFFCPTCDHMDVVTLSSPCPWCGPPDAESTRM